MATIPLIDEATYAALLRTRDEMDDGRYNLAPIFIPVGPDPNLPAPMRILFVGQIAYQRTEKDAPEEAVEDAANGEPAADTQRTPVEALTLSQAAERAAGWQARLLTENKSAFWRATRTILDQALGAVGEPAGRERLPAVAGWSNLAKIHPIQQGTGKPPSSFLLRQADICVTSLRAEILRARPTATVLMTGSSWGVSEILYPAFGDSKWRQTSRDCDRVTVLVHPEFGPLLWTDHPGGLPRDARNEALGFVAGYIAGLAERGHAAR